MEIKPDIKQKVLAVLGSLSQDACNKSIIAVKERLNVKVSAQSCNVYPFSRKEIKDQIGATGSVMTVGVFTPVMGDLPGAGFLMLTKDKAVKFVTSISGARSERPVYLPAFTSQIILKMLTEGLTHGFANCMVEAFQKRIKLSIGAPETFFETWSNTLDLMFSRLEEPETEVYFIFILGFIFSIDKIDHQGFYFYLMNQKVLYNQVTKN